MGCMWWLTKKTIKDDFGFSLTQFIEVEKTKIRTLYNRKLSLVLQVLHLRCQKKREGARKDT